MLSAPLWIRPRISRTIALSCGAAGGVWAAADAVISARTEATAIAWSRRFSGGVDAARGARRDSAPGAHWWKTERFIGSFTKVEDWETALAFVTAGAP
ncbi:hypothetical protein GCM10023144_01960 [Pigmentiphaga soli]|uniref:Uncharacterized protein n=1 Tax=Pigmentiphaga soli TaxID=1007095 RepID=A0ABP8GDB7_9BURK